MLLEFAKELTLLGDGRLRHEGGGSRIHLKFHVAETHLQAGREEFVLSGGDVNEITGYSRRESPNSSIHQSGKLSSARGDAAA